MLSRKVQKAMHRLRTSIALVYAMVWLAVHWPEHNHEQPLKIFSSMQTDVTYALAMHWLRIGHALVYAMAVRWLISGCALVRTCH